MLVFRLFRNVTWITSKSRNSDEDSFYRLKNYDHLLSDGFANTPTSVPINPPESNKEDYEYIMIGVYTFFITVFAIGLVTLCAGKVKKACCDHPEEEPSSPYEASPNIQDNDSCNVQIGVDNPELETSSSALYDDDEFDYYSLNPEGANDTDNLISDKPPAYEDPPPYSVT